jgi:hypothetical protein
MSLERPRLEDRIPGASPPDHHGVEHLKVVDMHRG